MEEIKDKHTYFLFTKNKEGNIIDFSGPLFDDEVEQCRIEYFENLHDVDSLQEETFKILYNDDYLRDFHNNWTDYIGCLLDKLELDFDMIGVSIDEEEEDPEAENFDFELDDEVIVVYNICTIKKNDDVITIQFNFEAKPYDVANLMLNLHKYCLDVIEVEIFKDTEEEEIKYFNEKLNDIYLN